MNTVTVVGRFLNEDQTPIEGEIAFLPKKMWFTPNGETYYATYGHITELDEGRFKVDLDPYQEYICSTPVGKWIVRTEDPALHVIYLKDLLPSRFQ